MIFFKPWVGKVIFAQTTGGLCVITPKIKSTISFEETLERFNKKKSKELIVNDLQHEITVVKQEIIELKKMSLKTLKVITIILNKNCYC